MKLFYVLLATFFFIVGSSGTKLSCKPEGNITIIESDMTPKCKNKMQEQFQKEFSAARTYLAMGAHFAQESYNRLGFSEFFFKAANEEREHGIKILEYLLMRNQLITNFSPLKDNLVELSPSEELNGLAALKFAHKLETTVTQSIHGVIKECEKSFNDYHLVDYLTTDFLDEQYKGERDLAGKISTLAQMVGPMAEFLFDKRLLNNENFSS